MNMCHLIDVQSQVIYSHIPNEGQKTQQLALHVL